MFTWVTFEFSLHFYLPHTTYPLREVDWKGSTQCQEDVRTRRIQSEKESKPESKVYNSRTQISQSMKRQSILILKLIAGRQLASYVDRISCSQSFMEQIKCQHPSDHRQTVGEKWRRHLLTTLRHTVKMNSCDYTFSGRCEKCCPLLQHMYLVESWKMIASLSLNLVRSQFFFSRSRS